eukprot:SAG11_NODE_231_length_11932_cov_40.992817_8_plen_112_part_00
MESYDNSSRSTRSTNVPCIRVFILYVSIECARADASAAKVNETSALLTQSRGRHCAPDSPQPSALSTQHSSSYPAENALDCLAFLFATVCDDGRRARGGDRDAADGVREPA